MFKFIAKLLGGGSGGIVALVPLAASAATLPTTCLAFLELINRVAVTFAAFIFVLSIIMVLVAAFNFVTAGGNAEKVAKARSTLVFSAVGIAVALIAFVVPQIVVSFFGGAVLTTCG